MERVRLGHGRRVFLAASASALISACSLLTNLSDLPAGATSDGGGGDAPEVNDAALDGPFCKTHPGHALCADFDEGSYLLGWTSPETYGNTPVLSLADGGTSPPASLLSQLGSAPDASGAARLRFDFPATATALHVELSLNASSLTTPSSGELSLLEIYEKRTSDALTAGVNIQLSSSGAEVRLTTFDDAGGRQYQSFPLPALPTGWFRVDLDVALGVTGSLAVAFDHQTVLQRSGLTTMEPGIGDSAYFVGLHGLDTAAASVTYDDVLIDTK